MVCLELESLVLKFKSLWKPGLDAHLDVDTSADKQGYDYVFGKDMHQVLFMGSNPFLLIIKQGTEMVQQDRRAICINYLLVLTTY